MRKAKIMVPMLLMMLSLSALSVPVTENPVTITAKTQPEISPMANEVEWIYRTYNGKEQKRLWSKTYNCWLTDWIDC